MAIHGSLFDFMIEFKIYEWMNELWINRLINFEGCDKNYKSLDQDSCNIARFKFKTEWSNISELFRNSHYF